MFFKKNKINCDDQVKQQIEKVEEQLLMVKGIVEQNHRALQKHGITLEDIVDCVEQNTQQWNKDKLYQDQKQGEIQQLLNVIRFYQEQVHAIGGFLSEDIKWNSTIEMIYKKEKVVTVTNGITAITEEGIPYTYELHEIIDVKETVDVQKDGLVEKVHIPGCMYQGNVVQKAKVTVYRFESK